MARWYSRNKFGAIKQEYKGEKYDSKLEMRYAQQLDLMKKAKEIKGWRRQEKIRMEINGKLICTYKIDFIIEHNNGTEEYVETKGYETAVWRLKWKLFDALYPDIKKTIVKR